MNIDIFHHLKLEIALAIPVQMMKNKSKQFSSTRVKLEFLSTSIEMSVLLLF